MGLSIKKIVSFVRKVNVVDILESGIAIVKIIAAGIKSAKSYFIQAKEEIEKVTKPADHEKTNN